jgi:hypothetical protein
MRTKKARVNVLRATDVFQMSQTDSGGLRLRRADPVVLVLTPLKKRLSVLSAFLRCHGEKGGGLLMNVFAATFWTLDVAFFVFRKGKNYFKWLLAIFAVELVARHGDLRKNARAAGSGLLNYGVRSRIAGVKASGYLEGGQCPVSAVHSIGRCNTI